MEFLAKPGAEGGCEVTRVERADVAAMRNDQAAVVPCLPSFGQQVGGAEDLGQFCSILRRASFRKAVPPVELWRGLLYSERIEAPTRPGVGCDICPARADTFARAVSLVLACVRRSRKAPRIWHKRHCSVLDTGIKQRIIGIMGSLGKCVSQHAFETGCTDWRT